MDLLRTKELPFNEHQIDILVVSFLWSHVTAPLNTKQRTTIHGLSASVDQARRTTQMLRCLLIVASVDGHQWLTPWTGTFLLCRNWCMLQSSFPNTNSTIDWRCYHTSIFWMITHTCYLIKKPQNKPYLYRFNYQNAKSKIPEIHSSKMLHHLWGLQHLFFYNRKNYF